MIPTDFPCPVAPAISTWGIRTRSTMTASLEMLLPNIIGSSMLLFINLSLPNMSLKGTISRFLLGTSIPMVPLPGIGAMMRMPNADKLSAISSSRFFILEILTPASGTIS